MNERSERAEPYRFGETSGVRGYLLLCLASLGVIFVLELQYGASWTLLLLLGLGLAGVILRIRLAPMLFVLVLAAREFLHQFVLESLGQTWYGRRGGFNPTDVALAMAVLGYVVAHFRLQSLTRDVVPSDPRRRDGPPCFDLLRWQYGPTVTHCPRSPRLVSPEELALFVLVLPGWALLGELTWMALSRWHALGFEPRLARGLLVAWLLGVGLPVVAGLLGYWRRCLMTPAEATMFLQDTLWRETRREQRRVQGWLAWSRQRRRRGTSECEEVV